MNRESERREQKSKDKRRRSLIEASYAKSGVLLDGTPSEYLAEQAGTDELNVQRQDQVSKQKRMNYLYEGAVQSNEYKNQASAYKSDARGTLISGTIGMASSAMTMGAGGGAFSWMGGASTGLQGAKMAHSSTANYGSV